MPLYEYECEACQHRTEVLQRFDDAPLEVCPECSGRLTRLISAPAVQFKGTGWYVTDYGGKKPQGGDSASSSESTSDAKDSAKSEKKAEKKATTAKGAD